MGMVTSIQLHSHPKELTNLHPMVFRIATLDTPIGQLTA